MNNNEEDIMRDLIYEEFNRQKLAELEHVSPKRNFFLYVSLGLAASMLILLGVFQFMNAGNEVHRYELADTFFDIPDFSSSRSELGTIDNFQNELKEGKYEQVLVALDKNALTATDKLAELYLLVQTDDLISYRQKSKAVLKNYPQYESQISWMDFVVEFKDGKSKSYLQDLMDYLEEPYLAKAEDMLEAIQ